MWFGLLLLSTVVIGIWQQKNYKYFLLEDQIENVYIFPYEWKILEWDIKQEIINQSNGDILYSVTASLQYV
jgi:hypothetical protein